MQAASSTQTSAVRLARINSFSRGVPSLAPIRSDASLSTSIRRPLAINYAGYIVDSSRVVLVETADELGGDTGGIAFAQGSQTGGFSSASLSGQSYVVTGQGSDANGSLTFAVRSHL